jgi:hypothetical protein
MQFPPSTRRFAALLAVFPALLTLAMVAALPAQAQGHSFYVSPDGTADGDGSRARPWSLVKALAQPEDVKPGDTVWMRGGTYKGRFESKLAGTAAAPVILRQAPGERATIDGALWVNAPDAWYWGFEVMDSDPVRWTAQHGSDPKDVPRFNTTVKVDGPRTKLINLAIHDLGNGIGFNHKATDAEVYGCIIYYNGWQGPDRGNGHGIYIQNQTGTKRITDVISFDNFSTGMKAFGEQGYANNVTFEGVMSFCNGSIQEPEMPRDANLFVGTAVHPAEHIVIRNNYLYHAPNTVGGNLALGYLAVGNGDAVVQDNYVAGSDSPFGMSSWRSATVTGNTFYATPTPRKGRNAVLAAGSYPSDTDPAAFTWDHNTYFDTIKPWEGNGKVYSFQFNTVRNAVGGGWLELDEWKKASGFDANSTYQQTPPTGTHVFVRPNRYETGRAHVAVYNWDKKEAVDVDASNAGLKTGERYEVIDARNYFGPAVASGTYRGEPIRIPMNLTAVSAPVGKVPTPPVHSAPEFGVFIIRKPEAR